MYFLQFAIKRKHLRLPSRISYRYLSISSKQAFTPFNVLFLGGDEFSVTVLDQLYKHHDVWNKISVVTHPDQWIGRKKKELSVSPLKIKSLDAGLDTHLIPTEKSAFRNWVPPTPFKDPADSENNILITASFGRMIPDHFLHLFPESRRLNVHPSLLPLYRGPAPIQHTIIDDKKETGVCVLEMKEKKYGADCGEIWRKKSIVVPPATTYFGLRDILALEGGKILVDLLRDMMKGPVIAFPQDEAGVTRAPFITRSTTCIDFQTWDAPRVERIYRAVGHQEALYTYLPSGKALQLFCPQVYPSHPMKELPKPLQALKNPGSMTFDPTLGMVAIRCANDSYIHVPFVKQQDKRRLAASDWWLGVNPQWLSNKVLQFGPKIN
ncbi:Formyltransferase [Pyrrhoderma noxium]|uniref:methionyl-tRNA formyltransferase n=1 Tax=Pyrrhoderma noxium TaxID=2282107 RepID=A0A286U6I8_9AGAM|nr:Formyltransferase [Pyrrhoderma noxium]